MRTSFEVKLEIKRDLLRLIFACFIIEDESQKLSVISETATNFLYLSHTFKLTCGFLSLYYPEKESKLFNDKIKDNMKTHMSMSGLIIIVIDLFYPLLKRDFVGCQCTNLDQNRNRTSHYCTKHCKTLYYCEWCPMAVFQGEYQLDKHIESHINGKAGYYVSNILFKLILLY